MFEVLVSVVDVDHFHRLRIVSGLTPRNKEAAKLALPTSQSSFYCYWLRFRDNLGRIRNQFSINRRGESTCKQ